VSAVQYRLTQTETLAIARGRLADIDALIEAGDSSADWHAERIEQVRLIAQVAA